MNEHEAERKIAALEEKISASKDFVNLIAHQLQEPLASVKWQLEALLAEESGALTDDQRAAVTKLHSVNHDAIQLVKDLLFLARFEGKRLKVNRTSVDLRDVVGSLVARYEPVVARHHGVLVFEPPHDSLELAVDARLLTQAIDNLISNSVKYNPVDMRIEISLIREDDAVVIWVKNDGPGIPRDKHNRLFKKFSRLNAPETQAASGTGLGLFITKQIVDLHGGTVGVESDGSKGAAFSISLPLVGS